LSAGAGEERLAEIAALLLVGPHPGRGSGWPAGADAAHVLTGNRAPADHRGMRLADLLHRLATAPGHLVG